MDIKDFVRKLSKHARSEQAASTLWALVGLAGPTFLQLIYIIVAARVLGADITGNFFLIVSVALVASSFVGLGAGGLVMRDTARDANKAPIAFGRAQAMSYVTFPILLPLVVAGGWYVTKGGGRGLDYHCRERIGSACRTDDDNVLVTLHRTGGTSPGILANLHDAVGTAWCHYVGHALAR